MTLRLDVWIGRDNVDVFELTQDGDPVTQGSVTKVQIRFGDFCISTDDDDPLVEVDNDGVVEATLGKVDGLTEGEYSGHIVVYDNVATDGIMWQQLQVTARDAEVCE